MLVLRSLRSAKCQPTPSSSRWVLLAETNRDGKREMRTRICMVALPVALVLLASCGIKTGFIRDARSSQVVKYQFPVRDMKHIRTVSGSSSYWSVLCCIPLGENLYQSAMKRLHEDAQLQKNQSIMNMREDLKIQAYLIFACKYTLTVSGDVVQFYRKGDGQVGSRTGRTVPASRPQPRSPTARRLFDRARDVAGRAVSTARRAVSTAPKPAPKIIDMAPTAGPPGTRITIVGRHLNNITGLWLSNSGRGRIRLTLTPKSNRRLYATVPSYAHSGALVVQTASKYITTSFNFVVRKTADTSPPPVQLSQRLSAKEIRATMTGLARPLRKCFRRYKARGIIKLRITLEGATGITERVKAVGRYRRSRTARCVVKAVSGTFFGRFKSERQTFTYPVSYR